MATELTPVLPPVAETYRPISILAIFAAIISLGTFVVWFPTYELGLTLWILIAVPCLLIAAFALRHIKRSEGMLAGRWLAGLAVLVCLVNVVGWPVMYAVVQFFIVREAKELADHWLNALKADDAPAAFVDTQPNRNDVYKRSELDPKTLRAGTPIDTGGNQYDNFRKLSLPAAMLRYKEKVEVTPLGLKEWSYQNGAYNVVHRYHVRTPEIEGEAFVTVRSIETIGPDGRKRRTWYVVGGESGFPGDDKAYAKLLTIYGTKLKAKMTGELSTYIQLFMEGFDRGDRTRIKNMSNLPQDHPGLELLFQQIREDAVVPEAPAHLRMTPPLLILEDTLTGTDEWKIKLQCSATTRTHEVIFVLTCVRRPAVIIQSKETHEQAWVVTDCQFVSKRKRSEPKQAQQP